MYTVLDATIATEIPELWKDRVCISNDTQTIILSDINQNHGNVTKYQKLWNISEYGITKTLSETRLIHFFVTSKWVILC